MPAQDVIDRGPGQDAFPTMVAVVAVSLRLLDRWPDRQARKGDYVPPRLEERPRHGRRTRQRETFARRPQRRAGHSHARDTPDPAKTTIDTNIRAVSSTVSNR